MKSVPYIYISAFSATVSRIFICLPFRMGNLVTALGHEGGWTLLSGYFLYSYFHIPNHSSLQ